MKGEVMNHMTCPCGGRIVMGVAPSDKKHLLVHVRFKCKKCGAWFGGYTYKEKPREKMKGA